MQKMKVMLTPVCDILAWCLMPNHFHILISVSPESVKLIKHPMEIQKLSWMLGKLLSAYAQAINRKEGFVGNLFQQGTRRKCVLEKENNNDAFADDPTYLWNVFQYIHNNPVEAGLVDTMEDWAYSSVNEYLLSSDDTICNTSLAGTLMPTEETQMF